MKLADIPDSEEPLAILDYAKKHNYIIKQYEIIDKYPRIIKMFNLCIEEAIKDRCVEFFFHKVTDRYLITEDEHLWKLSILGFILKN